MESANLHHYHHQHQGQLVGSSSLISTTAPAAYGAGSPHAWTQNNTLNSSNNLTPRQKNEALTPHLNSSVIQELGFHWNSNAVCLIDQSIAHDDHLQLSKIKLELSDSFPKFSDMLNTPIPSSIIEDSHLSYSTYNHIRDEQKHMTVDLSENLLKKTVSSGFPINNAHQFSPAHQIYSSSNFGSTMSIPSRWNFSQIYPSIKISDLNRSPSSTISATSFEMNLQALDLLTSSRFSRRVGQNSHDNLGMHRDGISDGFDDRMQQSSHYMRPCSPSKVSSFSTNEITEAKRPSNSLMEPKATQAATKKSRLESRASCPPFKVRKEKLGDRIAALQQLVAPFGKTDTASVLMEAIGYIKFLQNQVETLSVPYMKSSRNKNSTKTTQAFQGSSMDEGNDEAKKDLRSQGLCLVPLSCMSYITGGGGGSGGGGIWPPPNFGGGT